ncbi:helix-turn-helix transcriptional regulator [Nocardioides sp.]|uniref:helix-turn-helix transcriptional regulator n=1 Tax=Nocardioides sp. TaxID=35761 RepID=UPI002619D72B|nr:helix-turn-helix transcriptional regulator [Nocardioides sp.]MDI6911447.1 helix-turn-helix transcriptional regulator [Nocardioides sp.]
MVEQVGVGIGPHSRIREAQRQAALDAAAALQVRRSEVAAALARGESRGAEVVARTYSGINEWMREDIRGWRELMSVRPSGTMPQMRVSVPYNRWLIEHGLRMVSLFDHDGCDPEARLFLASEEPGCYRFGVGPVQMKIVDRRYVLLQGPFIDDEPTLMAVTAPGCLAAAWHYWHVAMTSSFPAEEAVAGGLSQLTPRQRQVVVLLAEDTRDAAIAEALGVSVRTVRSDLAELMEALGVRSRFAAGVRVRALLRA